jgi:hypothetical protein
MSLKALASLTMSNCTQPSEVFQVILLLGLRDVNVLKAIKASSASFVLLATTTKTMEVHLPGALNVVAMATQTFAMQSLENVIVKTTRTGTIVKFVQEVSTEMLWQVLPMIASLVLAQMVEPALKSLEILRVLFALNAHLVERGQGVKSVKMATLEIQPESLERSDPARNATATTTLTLTPSATVTASLVSA